MSGTAGSVMEDEDDGEDYAPAPRSKRRRKRQAASQSQPNTKKTTPARLPLSQPMVVLTRLPDLKTQEPANKTNKTNTAEYQPQQQPPTHNKQAPNISRKMQEVTHPDFTHTYELKTSEGTTRVAIADSWSKINPNATDEIIRTSRGFLLKTNLELPLINTLLLQMVESKVLNFGLIDNKTASTTTKHQPTTQTFSIVIYGVEHQISDAEISNHLNATNLKHRYCKRIISRATSKPTSIIRIITGNVNTFETLLSKGIYYKCRHYAVEASRPPEPIPTPCAKCSKFTHTTNNCSTPLKCLKCGEAHSTLQCTTQLPTKCAACNDESHVAWSMKCPMRPTKPIEGIPNIKIKNTNKKSKDVDQKIIQAHQPLHSPITLHDIIVNTYTSKINKPQNTNRDELLKKLKQKFIEEHNVDTTVLFSGSRMYIVMFDLDIANSSIATQPVDDGGPRQTEALSNNG